jgi:hypothetical protein
MENEDNKTVVAAVAAPTQENKKEKKQYKKREPIYDVRFSFTDSNMVRAKIRNDAKTGEPKKLDRRYDDKGNGLAVFLRETGKRFYAYKNVPMYNKKSNQWEKNIIYKKMFTWGKNTGFNCEAARDNVAEYLDKILDSRTTDSNEVTLGELSKKYIQTGIGGPKHVAPSYAEKPTKY